MLKTSVLIRGQEELKLKCINPAFSGTKNRLSLRMNKLQLQVL